MVTVHLCVLGAYSYAMLCIAFFPSVWCMAACLKKKYQSNKDILLQLGSMSIITSRLVFFLTESPNAHTHTHTHTQIHIRYPATYWVTTTSSNISSTQVMACDLNGID